MAGKGSKHRPVFNWNAYRATLKRLSENVNTTNKPINPIEPNTATKPCTTACNSGSITAIKQRGARTTYIYK